MTEEPNKFIPENLLEEVPVERTKHFSPARTVAVLALVALFCALVVTWYAKTTNQPPAEFPLNQTITISPGMDVRSITEFLSDTHVVKSGTFLYYVLATFYDPTQIKASTYIFETPLTVFEVAKRLTQGDFDADLTRFTHIEGERATLLAARANEVLPNFNAEVFLTEAVPLEGKLFPETYFIPSTFTETELLSLMLETYNQVIAEIQPKIDASQYSTEEVLTLASIIEREANSEASKKMVAGIFNNRLAIDMALQADATIEYALNAPLGELPEGQLAVELRELDSPYNTYLYPGLPPTPIGNPGLEAIMAVLEPTESDFFYYVTDDEGEFYYAKTYDEHRQNIAKYLR